MSENEDTQPALEYTERDMERLRPHMQKIMISLQREKLNQANEAMMDWMAEWLNIYAGVK